MGNTSRVLELTNSCWCFSVGGRGWILESGISFDRSVELSACEPLENQVVVTGASLDPVQTGSDGTMVLRNQCQPVGLPSP